MQSGLKPCVVFLCQSAIANTAKELLKLKCIPFLFGFQYGTLAGFGKKRNDFLVFSFIIFYFFFATFDHAHEYLR